MDNELVGRVRDRVRNWAQAAGCPEEDYPEWQLADRIEALEAALKAADALAKHVRINDSDIAIIADWLADYDTKRAALGEKV